MDTLVSNLEPDAANEVRQCWIDPGKFIAYQFLAKGKGRAFYVICHSLGTTTHISFKKWYQSE